MSDFQSIELATPAQLIALIKGIPAPAQPDGGIERPAPPTGRPLASGEKK